MRFVFFFNFFASSDSEYKKRLSRARMKNRFFCDDDEKRKNGFSKEEHEVKHMQTHVNTPAKNHTAQRYHLSLWF
jgi:hypothetical protein